MTYISMELKSFDVALFGAINGLAGTSVADNVMYVASSHATWLILALGVLAWAVVTRRWQLCGQILLVGLAVGFVDFFSYNFLKPFFQRPRPCIDLATVKLLVDYCSPDFGFPSNHAANGMATVSALVLAGKRKWAKALILPVLLVGVSRVYLGVHYPGDVLAGFVVGGVVGGGVYTVLDRLVSGLLKVRR